MTIRIKHPDKAFLRALREAGVDVGPKDTPKPRTHRRSVKRIIRHTQSRHIPPNYTDKSVKWIYGVVIVVVVIIICFLDTLSNKPSKVNLDFVKPTVHKGK